MQTALDCTQVSSESGTPIETGLNLTNLSPREWA